MKGLLQKQECIIKMDEKHKIICINEVVETGEYLEDGYTKNIRKTFFNNPNGYYMYFKEIMQKELKDVTLEKKIYIWKMYGLFFFIRIKSF